MPLSFDYDAVYSRVNTVVLSETLRALAEKLAHRPGDPETVMTLERLLEVPSERLGAAQFLAPVYEKSGETRALDRVLSVLADYGQSSKEQTHAWERLQELRRQQGDWEGAVKAAEKLATLAPDPEQIKRAWKQVAQMASTQLKKPEKALEAWLEVLKRRPDDAEAKAAVAELSSAPVSEKAAMLSDQILNLQPSHPEAQAVLGRRLEPTEALLLALRKLETSDAPAEVLEELHSAALKADALDEVCEAVEAQSERVHEPAQVVALLRFSARAREALSEPQRAVVHWNDLLGEAPHDAEALEHLQKLLGQSGDAQHAGELGMRRAKNASSSALSLKHLVEAAEYFLAAKADEAALRALADALQHGAEGKTLGWIQLQRGILLEKSGHSDSVAAFAEALNFESTRDDAAQGLNRALTHDRTRVRAAIVLERHARKLADPALLAAALVPLIEVEATPSTKAKMLLELSELQVRLNDPRSALASLMRAFPLAPSDDRVVRNLESLASELHAREELLGVYEEQLERAPNEAALAKRVAQLYEALGHVESTFAAWEKAAESNPTDLEVLETFASKAQQRQDWVRFKTALQRIVDAAFDPARKLKAYIQLAELNEKKLLDPGAAARAWEEALLLAPSDEKVLDALIPLYESLRQPVSLTKVLTQKLALLQKRKEVSVPFLLRLAELQIEMSIDESEALSNLRQVFLTAPGNQQAVLLLGRLAATPSPVQGDAFQLLATAADSERDPQFLVQAYEAQLSTTVEPHARANILTRLSELHEKSLQDDDLAFLAATRALREVPTDTDVLQRCSELADKVSEGEALNSLLSELVATQSSKKTRAYLFRALAERSEGEEAIAAWSEVVACSPEDEAARTTLQRLFENAGRMADVAVLERQKVDAVSDEERPKALLELARVQEKAGDLEQAATTLLNSFALRPDTETLEVLERVLNPLGRHLERAEVLARLAQRTQQDSQQLKYMLAQAQALKAADAPERAVSVLQEVLHRVEDEPRAVAQLVVLATDPRSQDAAVALLRPVFKNPGAEMHRASVLEALSHIPGLPDQREVRHQLALLHERLGDLTQAYAGRLRLVREEPSDAQARKELERLAQAGSLQEEIIAAYQEFLEDAKDPQLKGDLLQAIGEFHLQLNHEDAAIQSFEHWSRVQPQALAPLERLVPLFRKANDWAALASVRQRQIPLLTDSMAQVDALRELAQLAEGWLADSQLAEASYRQILQRNPHDVFALSGLSTLLDAVGKSDETYQTLDILLSRSHDEEQKASLRLKMGTLAQTALKRPAQALEHFSDVLRRGNFGTTSSDAAHALESMLSSEPSLAPQIAEALEPWYRACGDQRGLSKVLALQTPGRDRLQERARLAERLGQEAEALKLREQLFAIAPNDHELRLELIRLGRLNGRLVNVAQLLEKRANESLSPLEATPLWESLVELDRELQRHEQAEVFAERLVEQFPRHAAAAYLRSRYLQTERWPKLAQLIRVTIDATEDAEERTALWLELGDLFENKIHDDEASLNANREAMTLSPTNAVVHANLERLLEKTGKFTELKERLSNRSNEPTMQVRLAKIEHELFEDEPALARLVSVVSEDERAIEALLVMMRSGRPIAVDAARRIEALGKPEFLAEALEVQAREAGTADRVPLLQRLIELYRGDPQREYETLERLLKSDPGDGVALTRMLELAPQLRIEDQLGLLLRDVAARAPESAQRRVWLELAQLSLSISDVASALAAYHSYLVLEATDEKVLAQAITLAQQHEQWTSLVAFLVQKVALEKEPEARATVLDYLGQLYVDKLNDTEAAVQAYRRLLAERPDDPKALARLENLYRELSQWNDVAEVLARRIALAPDDATLKLQLARVRLEQLKDPLGALPLFDEISQHPATQAEALLLLEQMVQAQPEWEAATDVLLNAYRKSGDGRALARVVSQATAATQSLSRRRLLYLELSELKLKHEDDVGEAFLALAQAFRETPADTSLRERLYQIAQTGELSEEYAALLEEVLPRLENEASVETSLALAKVQLHQLHEPERALSWLRLAAQPSSTVRAQANAELDAALTTLERWSELAVVLAEREEQEKDVDISLRLGRLWQEKLHSPQNAIEVYRRILDKDPGHIEAALALENLYERGGARSQRIEILSVLEGLLTGVARTQVRLKLARLCTQDDYERVLVLCRKILQDDPLHPEAFELLTERLEAGGRWLELEHVLSARMTATLSVEQAAALAFRIADVAFHRRADFEKAEHNYKEVLERFPKHLKALEGLAELYERTLNQLKLLEILTALVPLKPELSQQAIHLRRAELLSGLSYSEAARQALLASMPKSAEAVDLATLERLKTIALNLDAPQLASQLLGFLGTRYAREGRLSDAVDALFRQADLNHQLGNFEGTCSAWEEILRLEPTNRRAYDRVSRAYWDKQRWRLWAGVAIRYLPHFDERERIAAWDSLAQVSKTHLSNPTTAFGFVVDALKLDAASESRRALAEELAIELNRVSDVVAIYRERLSKLTFGADFVAISVALARLEDAQLNNPSLAEQTLRAILAHDPAHVGALEALAAMFERRNDFRKLAETHEAKLEVLLDGAQRTRLLQRLALLYENQLHSPESAEKALRRLVEADQRPEHARLLVDLYRRGQRWPEMLRALLKLRSICTKSADRAVVQLEIANLHQNELDDAEGAITAFGEVLNYDAMSSAAFEALERLYSKLERATELLKLYEQRLARTQSSEEKLSLWYKSADLWEAKGNSLAADRCLAQVVAHKPDEVKALEGLCRLRRAGQRYRSLTESLSMLMKITPPGAARAELFTEQGIVFSESLSDATAAANAFGQALVEDPKHRPAIRALAKVYERERRYLDAVEYVRKEGELETDLALKAGLECKVGELYEGPLKDVARAMAAYTRALQVFPVYLPALRHLRRLYFNSSSWVSYEENLAIEAKFAPEPDDRYASAVELARHFEQRMNSKKHAITWYEHALAIRPTTLEVANPLADLLISGQAFARATEVLKIVIAGLEGTQQTRSKVWVERLCDLGEAHWKLNQAASAVAAFTRALEAEPLQPRALRGAFEGYEAQHDWTNALQKLEAYVQHHASGLTRSDRAQLSYRLGILYSQLGRNHDALLACERALELEAQMVDALRLGAKTADSLGVHEQAVQLKQRLADLSEKDARFDLLVELARQAHDKLNNPARAVEALLQAQALVPTSKQVHEQLAQAYTALGHIRKAAEFRMLLLQHPESTIADKRTHTLALAELYSKGMGEVTRAAELLERSLDEAPNFVEAFQALEALYTRARDYPKLDEAYQRMVSRLGSSPDSALARAAIFRSIGELRRSKLKDKAGAFHAFEKAVQLAPSNAESLELYAAHALSFPERVSEGLSAYLAALPTTQDPAVACLAFMRIGETRRDADLVYLSQRALSLYVKSGTHPPARMPAFRRALNDTAWREWLLHPYLRAPLAQLMALLWEQVGQRFSKDEGHYRLNVKKHLLNLRTSTHAGVSQIHNLSQVLALPAFEVLSPYLQVQSSSKREPHPDDSVAVKAVPTWPPRVVVGERLLNEKDASVSYAYIGRGLGSLRSEILPGLAFDADEIRHWLDAALSLGDGRFQPRSDAKEIKSNRKVLEKALSPQSRAALSIVSEKLWDKDLKRELATYHEGVRLTPFRVALLLAGDFAPVRTSLSGDAQSNEAVMRGLLQFALSGELSQLRKAMGIDVQ